MPKTTIKTLHDKYKKGEKIVALTAYDAQMAGVLDKAGIDLILVGDSLGMTMLGYDTTVMVKIEQCLHHTAAVVRAVEEAFVVGDMPFLSSDITPEETLRNAGRFLQEAGAQAVKLEGGAEKAETVKRLVQSGIPVMGHIGLLPQHVHQEGGYRIHGRKAEEADKLRADALALQEAGVFSIVFEGMPKELAAAITKDLKIPTIGIGAGAGCSGQIQVIHDILGLFEDFTPKHTRRYAELGKLMNEAVTAYRDDVRKGDFPGDKESFS